MKRIQSISLTLVVGIFLIGCSPRKQEPDTSANLNTPSPEEDGYTTPESIAPPAELSIPAPKFTATDLTGKKVSPADLEGQVVMLNVWATWCPPCQHEMPVLEAYHQAHKDDGFVLVGVNWDDSQKEIESFIEEYALSFPIWMDTDHDARRVLNKPPMPCSYIIDRDGNLRLRWIGEVDLEALETYITPLLEE